jgi:hypothetical protein
MVALGDVTAEKVRHRFDRWVSTRESRERLAQQNLLAVRLVHVEPDSGLVASVRLDYADKPVVEE